jgi:hypothetical protein
MQSESAKLTIRTGLDLRLQSSGRAARRNILLNMLFGV